MIKKKLNLGLNNTITDVGQKLKPMHKFNKNTKNEKENNQNFEAAILDRLRSNFNCAKELKQ